jgi:hypothetical protein
MKMHDLTLKTKQGWMVDRKGRSKPVDTVSVTFPVNQEEVVIQTCSIDVPLGSLGLSVAEMDELAVRWCRMRDIDTGSDAPPWKDNQCHAMTKGSVTSGYASRRCTKYNGYGPGQKYCKQHARLR